jgi:hypothetical protein
VLYWDIHYDTYPSEEEDCFYLGLFPGTVPGATGKIFHGGGVLSSMAALVYHLSKGNLGSSFQRLNVLKPWGSVRVFPSRFQGHWIKSKSPQPGESRFSIGEGMLNRVREQGVGDVSDLGPPSEADFKILTIDGYSHFSKVYGQDLLVKKGIVNPMKKFAAGGKPLSKSTAREFCRYLKTDIDQETDEFKEGRCNYDLEFSIQVSCRPGMPLLDLLDRSLDYTSSFLQKKMIFASRVPYVAIKEVTEQLLQMGLYSRVYSQSKTQSSFATKPGTALVYQIANAYTDYVPHNANAGHTFQPLTHEGIVPSIFADANIDLRPLLTRVSEPVAPNLQSFTSNL